MSHFGQPTVRRIRLTEQAKVRSRDVVVGIRRDLITRTHYHNALKALITSYTRRHGGSLISEYRAIVDK